MMKSQTKIIIRNLPNCMTKDQFLNEIGNKYRYNYLRFCGPDKSNKSSSTRAYINFLHEDDMYGFKDLLENKSFIDDMGNECYCIIEFAVYQKIPSKSKLDSKQNTISMDPEFVKFAEELKEPPKHVNIGSVESNLEEIKNKESDKTNVKTPLIEYLSNIPKKERAKKDDYRRKADHNKTFSKKDAENTDSKVTSKLEIKSVKKNVVKEGTNEVSMKNESVKTKQLEKADVKKGKVAQRNDIKTYAAAYEDYEYESWDKRGFDNKSYRGGRSGGYDGEEKGLYYYNSRNPDPYYRNYNYGGYSDYPPHGSYSRAPPQTKTKRAGVRRPPAYSTTRKD